MTRSNKWRPDQQGASAVEFALLMGPLLLIIMGSIEFGYRFYAQAIVTGTLRTAARMASTGQKTGDEIDAYVTSRLKAFRADGSVRIDKKSYANFSGVGTPEPVTTGSVELGSYCYSDVNKNGRWDMDSGTPGLGQPEDVIYYQASLSYKRLLPSVFTMMTTGPVVTVKGNTIVSNEPFAARNVMTPQTLCVKPS